MRYTIEFDEYGWFVIDTTIEDGESCNVDGATTKAEAEAKCEGWNKRDKQS
jgi:hypothetical protein